jgi:hypothetical protein
VVTNSLLANALEFRRDPMFAHGPRLAAEAVAADTFGMTLRSMISGHFSILPSAFFLSVFVLLEIKRSASMMIGFAIDSTRALRGLAFEFRNSTPDIRCQTFELPFNSQLTTATLLVNVEYLGRVAQRLR